jgi:mevalonate kinase
LQSIASAPGKVILFGEHFVVYGVKAILATINKRVTVTTEFIDDEVVIIESDIGRLEIKSGTKIDEIQSPLKPFYHIANFFLKDSDKGLKIKIQSDIPVGVGLGSSSACCVAASASISKLFNENNIEKILELAIDAERTIYANTSGADCTAIIHGGVMVYDRKAGFERIESVPDIDLVIINSKIEHSTEIIVDKVQKFKKLNESSFKKLCSDEEKLIFDALELLKNNKIQELGKIVKINHAYLKKIGVSNTKLESIVDLANRISYGAKITGAGGGGCIYSIIDKANEKQIIQEFKENNYECFPVKIESKGLNTL